MQQVWTGSAYCKGNVIYFDLWVDLKHAYTSVGCVLIRRGKIQKYSFKSKKVPGSNGFCFLPQYKDMHWGGEVNSRRGKSSQKWMDVDCILAGSKSVHFDITQNI